MTRLLVLSDLWPAFPGGCEALAFRLSRYLMQQGMDVQVVTGYAKAQQSDGPPLVIVPTIGHYEDKGWADTWEAIDAYEPDVILTHHFCAHTFGDLLASHTDVPLVQLVLNGQRLSHAAHAVYITDYIRSLDPTARPSDQTMWPPAAPDVVADSHGDAIGFIKPIPHKGVSLVYDIAERMPERRFVILRGEWVTLELIRELPNVEFMDPVDDMRDFYREVRLVLMPSVSEDAGTVAQECTLNGIPCVSSNVGGLAETNGGGIRVLRQDDLDTYVSMIRTLDDPDHYEFVVASMRRVYEAHDHPGRLAQFHQTIVDLASRS